MKHKIKKKIIELYLNKRITLLQKNIFLKNKKHIIYAYNNICKTDVIKENNRIDDILIDELVMLYLLIISEKFR